jgi:hypothetical protein
MCFEMLLQDLLALGLDIAPGGNSGQSSEVVESGISRKVADDGAFRSELVKENLRLVFPPKSDTGILCKSKPDAVSFTLAFDRNSDAQSHALAVDLARKEPTPSTRIDPTLCEPTGVSADMPAPTKNARKHPAPSAPATTTSEADANAPLRLSYTDIGLTQRSFEAMVYFLGEIVRAEENGVDQHSIVQILARNRAAYTETMFYVSDKLDPDDSALQIGDQHGRTHYLAKLCPKSVDLSTRNSGVCSSEYPDTESLAIVSLLNQIWGLEKQSTTPPASPVVLANPQ